MMKRASSQEKCSSCKPQQTKSSRFGGREFSIRAEDSDISSEPIRSLPGFNLMNLPLNAPVHEKSIVEHAALEYRSEANREVGGPQTEAVQRMEDPELEEDEDEVLQGKFLPVQRSVREEEPVQGKFGSNALTTQLMQAKPEPNRTGMPGRLKAGIESLSGIDMSDVRVHANSDKPAGLNALAYTQGNQIYLGPGEERHLPHEAWHAVQQKQGRVRATGQMKGVGLNDDVGLEGEADRIEGKALWMHPSHAHVQTSGKKNEVLSRKAISEKSEGIVQRKPINKKFEEAERELGTYDVPDNHLYAADESMINVRRPAFIVNCILSYKQIEKISDVVASILNGLSVDDQQRVGVVLGINAHERDTGKLDQALGNARQQIEMFLIPIGIVRSTWKGKNFPFGTMRNETLNSRETNLLTRHFHKLGLHPYISFQDFDTGSRKVSDDGEHVFNAVENEMNSEDEELWESQSPTAISRPIMIGGGYRPSTSLLKDLLGRLAKKWKGKTMGKTAKERVQSFKDNPSPFIASSTSGWREDMLARDTFAKVHPLLPYTPEPNLFVDALAVAKGPGQGLPQIQFGAGKAEFTELAKVLNQYIMAEIDFYYRSLHEQATAQIDVPKSMQYVGSVTARRGTTTSRAQIDVPKSMQDVGDGDSEGSDIKLLDADREEIAARVTIAVQNNRHPVRGEGIMVRFQDLTVETDLSRLADLMLRGGSDPQSHVGFSNVSARLFQGKPERQGVSIASWSKSLSKAKPEEHKKMREAFCEMGDEAMGSGDSRSAASIVSGKGLKFQEHNTLSSAVSFPFPESSPFFGQYSGLNPQNNPLNAHIISQLSNMEKMKELLNHLIDQVKKKHFGENGTPMDGNCLYHAINQVRTGFSNVEAAKSLRAEVVQWMLKPDVFPIVERYASDGGINMDALLETVGTTGNWSGAPGDLVPQLIASVLKTKLIIIDYPSGTVTELSPLIGGSTGETTIYRNSQTNHYSFQAFGVARATGLGGP